MARNEVIKVFSVDLTSGATLSGALDLRQGWEQIAIQVNTFASATDMFIHGATASNATYLRVMHPAVNTGTAQVEDYKIESGIAARMIPLPTGFQHIKVELSTGQTDTTTTFNVICKS